MAMKGKNCVAIAVDRRFGIQAQMVTTDFQKIFPMGDRLGTSAWRVLPLTSRQCKCRGFPPTPTLLGLALPSGMRWPGCQSSTEHHQ